MESRDCQVSAEGCAYIKNSRANAKAPSSECPWLDPICRMTVEPASAAVTLVKGDLRGIAMARRLSQTTMRHIRQSHFEFFYNLLGVPIAAGILYPYFGILLLPMIASAAMTSSSVSVISNARRLDRSAI